MAMRLIDSLATIPPLAELFEDHSFLQAMLDFEVALAMAEARLKIIPQAAAKAIAAEAKAGNFDAGMLAEATLRAGTPGIPLASALAQRVRARDAKAAGYVHWGATSQDIADTALMLILQRARPILLADLARVEKALRKLSDQHRNTVMLGRTLLQAAPPITFGLKAAGWFGAVQRARICLASSFEDALIVQFGGATGTLAALGNKGIWVGRNVATQLGLGYPEAPWHSHRDRLARLMSGFGVMVGSLGKIALDVSLMMQTEVGEVAEPGGQGRGGSSTMPHKRNPIGCALTLDAAYRVPALVASYLSGMVQAHERAIGGWQAEWSTVAAIVQTTGLAAASMAEVTEGLTVHVAKMRENIEATNGTIFAERAMMLLGEKMGRGAAKQILEESIRKSAVQGLHLAEILEKIPEVTKHLALSTLYDLETPEKYLGVAEEFRNRLLAAPKTKSRNKHMRGKRK